MKLALQIQIVKVYPEQSQEGFQAETWERVDKTHVHRSQAPRSSRGQKLPCLHRISPPGLFPETRGSRRFTSVLSVEHQLDNRGQEMKWNLMY